MNWISWGLCIRFSLRQFFVFFYPETLVSTTPSLKAALEIGTEGVQYDAEGQFSVAYERYEVALQKIVQHLSIEPRGRRKALLHQQVSLSVPWSIVLYLFFSFRELISITGY